MDDDKLTYTITETSRAVGIARTTIYRLLSEGKLRGIKLGGRTLILASSLRELIAASPAAVIKISERENP